MRVIPKSRVSWLIGMRRVNKIVSDESQNGYFVRATGMYSNDVDILVYKGNELVKVYEVTNYGDPSFFIQPDKGKRYLRNLTQYPDKVEKIFVCSFVDNLRSIGGVSYFTQRGIRVLVIGYQD